MSHAERGNPTAEAAARVAGILLAAGGSTRYPGGAKLLLPFGAGTVVDASALAALAAGLAPLVVVTGHRSAEVRRALAGKDVRFVENLDYAEGVGTSVAAGIREIAAEEDVGAAVILLGDEPGVAPEVIRSLTETWRRVGVAAARAVYRDRPGHPVIVDRRLFPALEGAAGREGVADLLGSAGLALEEVSIDAPAPVDIDTPADYRAAFTRE